MISGILNINKPQNMTSHDVVAIARRMLGIKKIGHTGTLDPMATGVLPICVGKATRIIEYLDMDMKTYRCTMKLGLITDTQDIWGKILEEREVNAKEGEIRKAFSGFSGVIWQKPPMYSALKVNGKKLYEYAREGKTVEVKRRQIYIKKLTVDHIDESEHTVIFTVECSKGTYIRTICQDVGELLGCGGVMTALERVQSGVFSVVESLDLEEFRGMTQDEAKAHLQPCEKPLWAFGEILTDKVNAVRFAGGLPLPAEFCRTEKEPVFAQQDFPLPIREEFRRAYTVFGEFDGEEVFLGTAFYDMKKKQFIADKVFFTR